jgi:hypothetical protein
MIVRRPVTTRSVGAVLAVAGLALGAAGCFTTAADFRTDAEKFIVDDADLAESLSATEGRTVAFVTATCEEPTSKDVGTTFTCNAREAGRDDAEAGWEFQIEIQESNNYDVTVSRFPTP